MAYVLNNDIEVLGIVFTDNISANMASEITVNSPVASTNITNSTSILTGAIHTNGGLGVVLDTFIGGTLDVATGASIDGGTLNMNSNKIINLLNPTNLQDVATKAYVDANIQGLIILSPCQASTTGALPANTRVVDVMTADVNGAFPAQDDIALLVGQSLLVKDEGGASPIADIDNGIYEVTDLGSAGTPWVLTRRADLANGDSAANAFTLIESGTLNGGNSYVCTAASGSDIVNTDPLPWTQFSQSGGDSLAVVLLNGNMTDGTDIQLSGGSSITSVVNTDIPLVAGNGSGADGGNITLTSGTGDAGFNGGDLIMAAGLSGTGATLGGNISLITGAPSDAGSSGGNLSLFASNGNGAGSGGEVRLASGTSSSGIAGDLFVTAGYSATGTSGNLNILAGTDNTGTSMVSTITGAINITGAEGTDTGGAVNINGGVGNNTLGGIVQIIAGNSSGQGGDILIRSGGGSVAGNVTIETGGAGGDITFEANGAATPIPINSSVIGQTNLDTTAQNIVGAINEIFNSAGGGSRIAYQVLSFQYIANNTIQATVAYLPWIGARYTPYTNGRILFEVDNIGADDLQIQVRDETNATDLLVLTNINASSFQNLALSNLPGALDARIEIKLNRVAGVSTDPIVYGITLEFDTS